MIGKSAYFLERPVKIFQERPMKREYERLPKRLLDRLAKKSLNRLIKRDQEMFGDSYIAKIDVDRLVTKSSE